MSNTIRSWNTNTRRAINSENIILRTTVTVNGKTYYAGDDLINQQTIHIPADEQFDGCSLRDHVEFFGLIK